LGTRAHAIRYIQQFTEIFTEEGRKSVTITRLVPGEPNRVTYTGVLKDRENAAKANAMAAAQAQLANQAAAHAAAQAVAQAAAAQVAAGQIAASIGSVNPTTPATVSATTNGLPVASQQHLQLQPNLMPILHVQTPQQNLSIPNSALLVKITISVIPSNNQICCI
jgi:hypothetical protein